MSGTREASIQAEFYRILKNMISDGQTRFPEMEFTKVTPGYNVDGGYADLVVFAKEDGIERPILVIETKRKVGDQTQYRFDPYNPKVIDQAAFYAMKIGADYFATTNGEVLVSFQTFKVGVPLPERRVKPYKIEMQITKEVVKLILEDLVRLHSGKEKWLQLDEVFVNRLRYFHSFIKPYVKTSLDSKLLDSEFKKRYEGWVKSQLFEVSENTNEQMASQAAYLLMNRILFYRTLETQRTDLPTLRKIDFTSGGDFTVKIREYFKKALAINYKAIFEEGVLNEIPVSNPLADTLNDFIEELTTYNLSKIRSDVLGRVYENLIPEDERHRLGQYYTPTPIVELITEMCIRSPNDKILDPGCGSGTFLVKAYYKLEELKKEENPLIKDEDLHKEILNQLFGIDINQFPASLSSINLATRNLNIKSDVLDVFVSDFFKIKPSTALLPEEGFDVVVANPPYTRQEEMEYKDQIRKEALTYSDGTKIDISAQAGIYAYFFTHSAKFLKNGGRMGYITSNTWLDVGFGEGLKQFFLDHFRILAIVEFDSAVFGTALVNTCVSILEKDEDVEKRQKNFVKFVRFKKPMEIGKVVSATWSTNQDYEDEQIRITSKSQEMLQPEDRWGKYVRAPSVYFRILNKPLIAQLGDIAEVRFGVKTGANEFFILDKEQVKLWGIEKAFLRPIATSIRELTSIELKPEDVKNQLLWVHGSKDEIKNDNVLKYINYGEEIEIATKRGTRIARESVKGVQNLRTCRQRKIWYDLGEYRIPPIIAPYMMWERVIFFENKANALPINTLHSVYPKDEKHIEFLLGLLNSTLTSFLLELTGRSYGGGVLKVEAYELKNLLIIDPNKVREKEKKRLSHALSRLKDAQRESDVKSEEKARIELDTVIFDMLELTETERKQVYEGLEMLRSMRLQRKEVKVLVETAEKWEPLIGQKKGGAKSSEEPSKRLETWIK